MGFLKSFVFPTSTKKRTGLCFLINKRVIPLNSTGGFPPFFAPYFLIPTVIIPTKTSYSQAVRAMIL